MRAPLNNLVLLLRVPVCGGVNVQNHFFTSYTRRLHSDGPGVFAAKAAPAPAAEARAPLTDLLGRRHNYLRISLTERCNLRCQYCMPADGVPLSPRQALLTRDELTRSVQTFAALGVNKVRLTGGEPTLRADLADIIQGISNIEGIESIAMTTNGLVLTRKLAALQRAGLTALNISLDSLKPERYEHMSRRAGFKKVLAGIDLALQLGYKPVKINVVLMQGFNDDEICDFVEFTRDREIEVRFIEFMPFTGNAWDDSKLVPHKVAAGALMERYPDARPSVPRANDTARVWQVPGFAGSVGFISSMTKNFCSTCNRLRLTADGNLKVCLFGASEISLRDAMREGASDEQLEHLIRTALRNKKPQHAVRASERAADDLFQRSATLVPRASHLPQKSSQTPLKTTVTLTPTFPVPPTLLVPRVSSHMTLRALSSFEGDPNFSHLDASGKARMVDIGDKEITLRVAEAECALKVGGRLLRLLRDARLPKGDALTVAQVAGVVGAKKTSELIPMCHPLPLDCVRIKIDLPKGESADGGDITVHCEVRCTARTGAEMEALTGAATAALTLYDMCKSVDKRMRVTNLRVVHKSGGRSGTWPRLEHDNSSDVKVRDYDTSPIKSNEGFIPTDLGKF